MRRRFQFSLRALFLAMLVVAIGCAIRGELAFAAKAIIIAAAVVPLAWLADVGLDVGLFELLWELLRPRIKRRLRGHNRSDPNDST